MPRVGVVAAAGVAATGCVVAAVGPSCLPVLLRDGMLAAAIVFCALGPGVRLLDVLGAGDVPRRWRLIVGCGLGLGVLGLLVLGLGLAGLLGRPLWLGLMGLCAAASGLEVRRGGGRGELSTDQTENGPDHGPWAWLVLALPAGLALAAASLPPGILWPAEANGYDVLEYHLAVPKEYWQAGRVSYLPHNLYANFPFGVEMLYLLAMVLRGDAMGAAMAAQVLHALIGVLAVAAIWLAARERSPRAGLAAALAAGTCPMLVYLGGLAYVENATLLYTALAVAAAGRARAGGSMTVAGPCGVGRAGPWWLIAGVCAGLACGSKYTAVVFVALPLMVYSLIGRRPGGATAAGASAAVGRQRRAGLYPLGLFMLGLALAFGPWLVKNFVYTGNPVFPLARGVFGERAGVWTDEAAGRWAAGHLPAPELRGAAARLSRLGNEVVVSELYGALVVAAIFAGIVLAARRRSDCPERHGGDDTVGRASCGQSALVAALVVAAVTIVAWLVASHLYGRFAVTVIPGAALLVAAGVERVRHRTAAGAIVLVIAAVNVVLVVNLCRRDGMTAVGAIAAPDRMAWFREGRWPGTGHVPKLNAVCDAGGRVLMVGEARSFYLSACVDYTVVFNRSALAEAVQSAAEPDAPAAAGRWLAESGYTHVYVGWSEMSRLSRSRYGFWPGVTPELFVRLAEAGELAIEAHFHFAEDQPPYGTLFRVAAR